MNSFLLIFKKELKRVFDDRKLLTGLFVTPVLTIMVLYSFFGIFAINMAGESEEHVPVIYVSGKLPEALDTEGFELNACAPGEEESISEMIKDGEADLLVIVPEGFEKAAEEMAVPTLSIFYDPSHEGSSITYDLFSASLEEYRGSILSEKYGDLTVFVQEDISLEDESVTFGKLIGSIVVMIMVIFIFASAMQQGIDSIAGEKERGTFASLLMTPVSRFSIAAGKTASLAVISILSAISIFIGTVVSVIVIVLYMMQRMKMDAGVMGEISGELGGLINISFGSAAVLLLEMIMMAVLSASVICFLSSLAKNVKQAGSYVSPVYIVVMLVCYIPMLTQGATADGALWYLIPLYGNINVTISLFSGSMNTLHVLLSSLSALLGSGALMWLTGKVCGREKYLF